MTHFNYMLNCQGLQQKGQDSWPCRLTLRINVRKRQRAGGESQQKYLLKNIFRKSRKFTTIWNVFPANKKRKDNSRKNCPKTPKKQSKNTYYKVNHSHSWLASLQLLNAFIIGLRTYFFFQINIKNSSWTVISMDRKLKKKKKVFLKKFF